MRDSYTPEFEETLRATVAVPKAGPEVVAAVWETVARQATRPPAPVLRPPVLRRRGALAAICLAAAILILGAFIFATPAGRVIAGRIAAFFTFAEQDWKPIPPEYNQATEPPATETPTPTGETRTPDGETAPPAGDIPSPAPTPPATGEVPPPTSAPADQPQNLTRAEVAALIAYPLQELQALPEGYQFGYAVYFPENGSVLLVYPYQPGSDGATTGEMIMLTLSPVLLPDEVGPDAAIEKVTINGFAGELVQGGWLALAGEAHQTWEPRMPVYTLRWFDGALYLKLQFHLNEPSSPSYLSRAQMLEVAQSIRPAGEQEAPAAASPASATFQAMEVQIDMDWSVG